MTGAAAIEAAALRRQFGRTEALRDLSVRIPAGRVVALVGPNGAGKTTFLRICAGLESPTSGHVEVLGWSPQRQPLMVLPRIGFVAQERPLYRRFRVRDQLALGRHVNPRWDAELALARLQRVGIPLDSRTDHLSGGQRAQLALAMALAKRPDLLLLDEPVADLDPLARRAFLRELMDAVAEHGLSVLLTSHIVSELERTCDYILILTNGELQVAGEIDLIVGQHAVLVGPQTTADIEGDESVLSCSRAERQTTLLVRTDGGPRGPEWERHEASLEDIVLAYMSRPGARSFPAPEAISASGDA